jgi:hypothetical protein
MCFVCIGRCSVVARYSHLQPIVQQEFSRLVLPGGHNYKAGHVAEAFVEVVARSDLHSQPSGRPAGQGGDEVDEKNGQMAHRRIIAGRESWRIMGELLLSSLPPTVDLLFHLCHQRISDLLQQFHSPSTALDGL